MANSGVFALWCFSLSAAKFIKLKILEFLKQGPSLCWGMQSSRIILRRTCVSYILVLICERRRRERYVFYWGTLLDGSLNLTGGYSGMATPTILNKFFWGRGRGNISAERSPAIPQLLCTLCADWSEPHPNVHNHRADVLPLPDVVGGLRCSISQKRASCFFIQCVFDAVTRRLFSPMNADSPDDAHCKLPRNRNFRPAF